MIINRVPLLAVLGSFACAAILSCGLTSKLTPAEKNMPEAKYYNPNFSPLPADCEAALSGGPIPVESALQYENVNDLLYPDKLDTEYGYCLNEDGTGYAAVKIDFPGATGDMIQWWFWWHAYKNIRYKIWYPGAHYAISFKNREQADNPALSYEQRRVNNIHYPWENVGEGVQELSIRFISPEEFGFDTTKFAEAGIEAVICGVVGYMIAGVPVEHTYMAHVFYKNEGGLVLRSRFWMGKAIAWTELQKLVITEDTAKKMAYHCAHEYSHLSEFLPEIYEEFR